MRFFLDNCVSTALARALRELAAGQPYEVVHLADKFERRDTPDPEWLGVLGREGRWIVVSGDVRITRGRAGRLAWQESGLTAFFFADGWASKNRWKQAEELMRWWPKVVQQAREAPDGAGFLMQHAAKEFKRVFASGVES